jgi:hypothetical protein
MQMRAGIDSPAGAVLPGGGKAFDDVGNRQDVVDRRAEIPGGRARGPMRVAKLRRQQIAA